MSTPGDVRDVIYVYRLEQEGRWLGERFSVDGEVVARSDGLFPDEKQARESALDEASFPRQEG